MNDSVVLSGHPGAILPRTSMLLIALALLAPFAIYFGTARSIVEVWNSSDTFAHGYIILPISLWLIWRRRANFAAFPPEPWAPALLLVAMAGAAWLLARMGEVQVVMQYAFVAMLPLIALAMLGRRLAWSLAFPLLFLLFAVPFGEIFVNPLIEFTADFTVWAVQATGIPVLRNGTRFELPTGNWNVVEACSGVRYLISSVTIGCLYAYLTYRSTTKRAVFVAMSVLVPIIANGLRAYMIVMIGHTSDMALATGVDHLVYGWLFFGIVMFAMFWVGSYWRDDEPPAPAPQPAAIISDAQSPTRIRNMALAVIAVAAVWPAYARYSDHATFNKAPVELGSAGVSWTPAAAFSSWTPRYMAADASFNGVYQGRSGPVALTILYYRNQTRDKALISSVNRMAGEKDEYHDNGGAVRSEQLGTRTLKLRETRMDGPGGDFLVWHWNWIDGTPVSNNYVGKLYQARAKLLFRGDDGAAVMVSAPYGERPDDARAAMRTFLEANLASIEASLASARGE
ncbi:MAG: exosortase A [Pseudomonadota bacterium]